MWRKGACRIKQQALSFLTSREGPYRQQPTAVFVWYTNNFSRTFPSYLPVCSWAAVTLFVTNVRTVFRFRTGCTLVAAMQWLNVANIDRTSELNCWWVLMQSTHWRRSIWCKSLMQLGLRQCFFFYSLDMCFEWYRFDGSQIGFRIWVWVLGKNVAHCSLLLEKSLKTEYQNHKNKL